MKLSEDVDLNLQRLIVSRMLVQANSGAGKSWALRRILEQTHGEVQQIVIDVEDEFYTLREKFDYILARKEGGDCVPEVRSAGLLAHRLLELGVSAIISIFEMKQHERIRFAREFLEALVNAPKKLWHPALVVVDEAHVFCPEKGEAESAGSVIDLMTRGRKRGFCGILATQRISKLNKDAAAEANNKLIGRAALDLDMKRGGEELGFVSKEDRLSLRQLKPGEFFAFGPAISEIVIPVKIGGVETTHPKAGAGVTPVAPPKHKVQSVLAKLADLPQEAEEERASVTSLQQQVRELKRELAKKPVPKTDPKQTIRATEINKAQRALEAVMKFLVEITTRNFNEKVPEPEVRKAVQGAVDSALKQIQSMVEIRSTQLDKLKDEAARLLRQIKTIVESDIPVKVEVRHNEPFTIAPVAPRKASQPRTKTDGSVPHGGLRRIMVSLAQRPNGLTPRQIGVFAGLSSKGGTFSTYLSRAKSNGWIEGDRNLIKITPAGIEALGNFEMLPSGEMLYQYWLAKLGNSGATRILQALYEAYPNALTKEEVGEKAQISTAGGSFSTYLSRLRSLELITGPSRTGGEIKASEELFE